MQRNTIFFIADKAVHVSGGFPANANGYQGLKLPNRITLWRKNIHNNGNIT
jgi:hypothetical protein